MSWCLKFYLPHHRHQQFHNFLRINKKFVNKLDFIDSLKPKSFVWDNRPEIAIEQDEEGNDIEVEFYSANKGKKDIGFIAQDLLEVDDNFLNLVHTDNPDKLEASYGRLIPVLVQAIKELKAEVELLKS